MNEETYDNYVISVKEDNLSFYERFQLKDFHYKVSEDLNQTVLDTIKNLEEILTKIY